MLFQRGDWKLGDLKDGLKLSRNFPDIEPIDVRAPLIYDHHSYRKDQPILMPNSHPTNQRFPQKQPSQVRDVRIKV